MIGKASHRTSVKPDCRKRRCDCRGREECEKQAEYLADILDSGHHLLSLINDILDLSKIEAGRMELNRSDFDVSTAIENTLMLMRERAHRRDITLARRVEDRLGTIHADERKE